MSYLLHLHISFYIDMLEIAFYGRLYDSEKKILSLSFYVHIVNFKIVA